jgi:hypothetical protein
MEPEFEFSLPHGYVDGNGRAQRHGRMRLATALDEIESVAHPKVEANEAYLPVVLLSRVVTQLGEFSDVTPAIIEGLYASDLAYLEDLYLQLNDYAGMMVRTQCPQCGHEFTMRIAGSEENA